MITSANVLDRRIRNARRDGLLPTHNAAILVRALFGVLQPAAATFDVIVKAANVLDGKGITPHQIRTNYRAAGITYDLVNDTLAQAKVA